MKDRDKLKERIKEIIWNYRIGPEPEISTIAERILQEIEKHE